MDSPPLTPPVPLPRRPRQNVPKEESDPDVLPEKDEPLQFIEFIRQSKDGNTTIRLIDKTVETITRKCDNRPMSIICICGPSRKGKSFILGYMLRYLEAMEKDESDWMDWTNPTKPLEGFKFRNGTKPETQGIWIWSRPFFIEREDGTQMAVLLMDTQGTYDAFTTNKDMSAIVGLSLLTSSVMIFNCFTDLQEDILTSLNTYTTYGQLAIDNITGTPFQKLIFLIRDWNNPSEYAYGKRGGKKFLLNALKILPEHAPEAKEIRENIRSCFSETDCFLMPHIGEKALLTNFNGSLSELSKDFARKLEEFINHLINVDTLTTKQFLDNEITAKELKTYLDTYIQIFNSNELPSATSMWEATTEAHNKGTIDKALSEFRNLLSKNPKNKEYLAKAEVETALIEAQKQTLEIFRNSKKIGTKNQLTSCKEKLMSLLEFEKEEFHKEIGKQRAKYIDDVTQSAKSTFQKLFTDKILLKSSDPVDFHNDEEVAELYEDIKDQVFQQIRKKLELEDQTSIGGVLKSFETYADQEFNTVLDNNTAQRANAEKTMTAYVKQLVNQYKEEMQKTTNEHLFASVDFLKNAQGQVKAFMGDLFFKCKKPGGPTFHKVYFEILQEKLEKVNGHVEDKHRLFLQDTIQAAHSKISRALEHFQNELKTRTINVQSKDEFMTINDQLTKEALARFHENGNPYPKDHPENIKAFDLLKEQLRILSATAQLDLSQRIDVSQYKLHLACMNHLEEAVKFYEDTLQINIVPDGISSEKDLHAQHENAQMLAWKKFSDLVEKSNHPNPDEFKPNFEQQIKSKLDSIFANKKLAQANIELLATKSHSIYEDLMKENFDKINTDVELKTLHYQAKAKAIEHFVKMRPANLPSSLFKNDEVKLQTEIEDTFKELQTYFELQEEKNVANLKAFVSDCRKYYHEEMETHSTNTQYIQPDELNKFHQQTKQSVITRCNALAPINDAQKINLENEMDILFEKYKEKNDMILNVNDFIAPAIGIDLGTTNCCVAVYYQGEVKVIENFAYQNKTTTASFVQLDENGTKSTGNFAKDNAYKDPENTIFDAKRILGRKFEDDVLQQDMKVWPFTVVKDEGIPKIRVNGKLYYPEQISAALLFELTRMVEKYLKLEPETIKKAVITVPAYFNDGQRNATIDAGEIAGLEVLTILNEPTAAAIAYSLGTSHHKGRKILVFDMGGGTFDVSVVDVTPGNITVLAVDGDTHLGGEDFDNRLVQHCLQEFKNKHNIDLMEERNGPNRADVLRRLSRLKQECEKAKIMLTSGIQATIFLDNIFTPKEGQGIDLEVIVTRATFERINNLDFLQAIDITSDAIKAAGLRKEQIDDVVLVGGSTRIPKLQEMLSNYFDNKALTYSINPDTAVAYGAAIQAAKLNGDVVKKEFSTQHHDVTPYSIGTDVRKLGNLLLSVIIKKNTAIPCKRVEQYVTSFDKQTSMSIQILQGENPVAKNNELLGEFCLDGIPPAKKGEEKVNVTMEIDTMGCLHVTAFCISTHGKKSMKITEHKLRMSAAEKRKLITEASRKF